MWRYGISALLVALGACGSDSPPSPPPTTAPTQAETPAEIEEPGLAPLPNAPVVVDAATKAHAYVQQRMHDGPLPAHDLVHFTPVEDPTRTALTKFHAALRDLEAGKDSDGKVRVAIYGASSVAADRYTAYLRGYLQHRFGDAGVGFISLVPLWRWHRHNAVKAKASKHWTTEHAQKEKLRMDGDYGLKGASTYATKKRAKTKISAKASAFSDPAKSTLVELYYLNQKEGGSFSIELGSGEPVIVSTKSDTRGPGYQSLEFEGSPMPISLQARGDGEVRLFGATLETAGPGVVVDELGIGGTRSANHLDWTESIWRDNFLRRSPSLVVFAYGANEAVDEDEPIEVYRENLVKVVKRYTATAPDASCLLIGPQDFPMKEEPAEGEPEKKADEVKWIARPRMDSIVTAQREVAAEHGCGFWDIRELMGGKGAMVTWVAAQPPLAKGDHLHLTPLGYLYLARTLTDALMADYDQPPA